MKRYLLFVFNGNYPSGGWNDFDGSFDNLKDAMKSAADTTFDNFQIVDGLQGKIIMTNDFHPLSQ
jgi:hypothetical protein